MSSQEEIAARKIQNFWRDSMRKRERKMERQINDSEWSAIIEESTRRNDELLEKLRNLRIAKSYDIQKFETLLRLPPREVNGFMESESKKSENERITEEDREKIMRNEEKKDRAARTLQKFFRKLHLTAAQSQYLTRIQRIRPKRRMEVLEMLNKRLNERRIQKRITGTEVQKALENHKEKQKGIGSLRFSQVQLDLRRSLAQTRPNSPTARGIPRLTRIKSTKLHNSKMHQIDLDIMKFVLDGNF